MPKYAAALCLAALSLPAVTLADDDPEPRARAVKPREIVAAGLPAGRGSVESPTSIPGEKHLAELVPDEGVRAAILKQVDFRKERLLLFSWTGGDDRLTPVEGKPGEATFEFVAGKARDLLTHAKLFAVPARAKVKVTSR
jgi:hypothetical protein